LIFRAPFKIGAVENSPWGGAIGCSQTARQRFQGKSEEGQAARNMADRAATAATVASALTASKIRKDGTWVAPSLHETEKPARVRPDLSLRYRRE
jgi:hypothetical protein